MKKDDEIIKIKFLGFKLECKNPSKQGVIVTSMVLVFLMVVFFFTI
jgi:hypothetical protein